MNVERVIVLRVPPTTSPLRLHVYETLLIPSRCQDVVLRVRSRIRNNSVVLIVGRKAMGGSLNLWRDFNYSPSSRTVPCRNYVVHLPTGLSVLMYYKDTSVYMRKEVLR